MPETNPLLTNEVKFKDIDGESSIKSNILVHANNWKILSVYLKNLKDFVVNISQTINIDNLLAELTANFYRSKTMIPISVSMAITESFNITQNGIKYLVIKLDEYTIKISNADDDEWESDRLLIQVKNIDGVIVYPFIKTKGNEILIQFNDKISIDYQILFV